MGEETVETDPPENQDRAWQPLLETIKGIASESETVRVQKAAVDHATVKPSLKLHKLQGNNRYHLCNKPSHRYDLMILFNGPQNFEASKEALQAKAEEQKNKRGSRFNWYVFQNDDKPKPSEQKKNKGLYIAISRDRLGGPWVSFDGLETIQFENGLVHVLDYVPKRLDDSRPRQHPSEQELKLSADQTGATLSGGKPFLARPSDPSKFNELEDTEPEDPENKQDSEPSPFTPAQTAVNVVTSRESDSGEHSNSTEGGEEAASPSTPAQTAADENPFLTVLNAAVTQYMGKEANKDYKEYLERTPRALKFWESAVSVQKVAFANLNSKPEERYKWTSTGESNRYDLVIGFKPTGNFKVAVQTMIFERNMKKEQGLSWYWFERIAPDETPQPIGSIFIAISRDKTDFRELKGKETTFEKGVADSQERSDF